MRVADYDKRIEGETINGMLKRRNAQFVELHKDFFKEHNSVELVKNFEADATDVFD